MLFYCSVRDNTVQNPNKLQFGAENITDALYIHMYSVLW